MSGRPCSLCQCNLIFVKGPNGATIPLDTVSQLYRVVTKDGVETCERVGPEERIYVTHFRTCPHANEFSKGKKAGV